ncbi:MAG TPA: hypothetical protein VF158_05720 [Longimicrobiales bacterium]
MRVAAFAVVLLLGGPVVARAQAAPSGAAPLRVTGYADFVYLADERPGPEGFLGGALLGAAEYAPAERWSVFAELGAHVRADSLDVALERVALRWAAHDALTLSLGRLHTPLAYWTAAYAPGSWNRTSITVPVLADPSGRLVPIHAVGARADGRLPAGPLEVMVSAGLANGRDAGLAGPGDAGDVDGYRAWSVAAELRPAGRSGLRLGGAAYGDRPVTATGTEVSEHILTAHAAFGRESPELAAEYARIRHRALGASHVSRAYYVQLGYRLPERLRGVKPYVRFEELDVAEGDPLFMAVDGDQRVVVAGARYDFLRTGALKAEFRSARLPGVGRFGSLRFEASFRLARPEPPAVLAAAPVAAAPEPAADSTAAKAMDPAPSAAPERRPSRAPDASRRAAAPAPRERRVEAVAIIVHPGTPVQDVTLPELRRIFRGEQQVWSNDERVVLLVRSPLPAERAVVLGRIYQMEEAEFRQFWLGKIFRDPAAPGPKMVSDVETARRLVASLPGAISFVPAAEVGPGVRVLRVDGKLPGEEGYPLQ